jgi:hypothetical protein
MSIWDLGKTSCISERICKIYQSGWFMDDHFQWCRMCCPSLKCLYCFHIFHYPFALTICCMYRICIWSSTNEWLTMEQMPTYLPITWMQTMMSNAFPLTLASKRFGSSWGEKGWAQRRRFKIFMFYMFLVSFTKIDSCLVKHNCMDVRDL